MRTLILGGLLCSPAAAHAFCGTYAGGAGSELYNNASSVILARQGARTTLTVANDFEGNFADFALLIPVPVVLSAEDVQVADPEIFKTVDLYSSPRTVAYACDEMIRETHWPSGGGCGLAMGCSDSAISMGDLGDLVGGDASGGVTVEAEFELAEYDIVVLSAEGAGGLYSWLDEQGYSVPAGGEQILQEYIDDGSYFMAAKVKLDQVVGGSTWLSPLRFSYEAPTFSLPVRVGTISSGGMQDLIVYTITDGNSQIGIANYPEATFEDECMLPPGIEDFGAHYVEVLDEAIAEHDRASWVVEYGWMQQPQGMKCDPCMPNQAPQSGGAPVLLDLPSMGFEGGTGYFTRLHLRYDPDQVDEDLVFYETGTTGNSQIRYVEYRREVEFAFPICGEGMPDDPGYCGDAMDDEHVREVGCSSVTMHMTSYLVFWLVLLGLRRRQ